MIEKKILLKKQIETVIVLLEQRLEKDLNKGILHTLYKRYADAKQILIKDDDVKKIMIKGGCRAYLDTFSDYMNPILSEMSKAEKLFQDIIHNDQF